MSLRSRPRQDIADGLADRPPHALVGTIRMPVHRRGPARTVARGAATAILILLITAAVVYADRDGYTDVAGHALTPLDAFYYAAVSATTAGYGDITPVSESARLINILVIMPLRVLFLVAVIATTITALTERSRQAWKIQRWRSKVQGHVVVIGYGTKGHACVDGVIGETAKSGDIVVVDLDQRALDQAAAAGLVTVHGSGTRSDVLRVAGVPRARAVVVATGRDDTAVLVTLTARELAPAVRVVAAVREAENVHLLRQSGADSVVVSSETAGRLLGMATSTPRIVDMVEDLITPETGLAIAEREVETSEVGGSPRHLPDIVLGVVRAGALHRVDSPEADALEPGDRLLYVRRAGPPPGER